MENTTKILIGGTILTIIYLAYKSNNDKIVDSPKEVSIKSTKVSVLADYDNEKCHKRKKWWDAKDAEFISVSSYKAGLKCDNCNKESHDKAYHNPYFLIKFDNKTKPVYLCQFCVKKFSDYKIQDNYKLVNNNLNPFARDKFKFAIQIADYIIQKHIDSIVHHEYGPKYKKYSYNDNPDEYSKIQKNEDAYRSKLWKRISEKLFLKLLHEMSSKNIDPNIVMLRKIYIATTGSSYYTYTYKNCDFQMRYSDHPPNIEKNGAADFECNGRDFAYYDFEDMVKKEYERIH